jgi:hypothetical protein
MFHPATLAIFIPITALMIPIIALLISHQQKMAQIIHGHAAGASAEQIEAMRRELQELRNVVGQQAIALDQLRTLSVGKGEHVEVRERLGG